MEPIDRRRFLQVIGGGAAAGVLAGCVGQVSDGTGSGDDDDDDVADAAPVGSPDAGGGGGTPNVCGIGEILW